MCDGLQAAAGERLLSQLGERAEYLLPGLKVPPGLKVVLLVGDGRTDGRTDRG